MKFGKKILSISAASVALTPTETWMDYKKLKKLLKDCELEGKKREKADEGLLKKSDAEKAFFKLLFGELNKVSRKYRELESKSLQNFILFIQDVEKLKRGKSPSAQQISVCLKECAEHHLRFVLLENYAVMNYCGFTKILKKHDKLTGYNTREKYMIKMVNAQPFAYHTKIQLATKLILKEFHLLQSLRQNKKVGTKSLINTNIVNKGLELRRVAQDTISSNGFISTSTGSEGNSNRIDDLVNLLEAHQKDLGSPPKRKNQQADADIASKKAKH